MYEITFKDTKVELKGFNYSKTYDGCLEGHPMYISWHMLRELWEKMQDTDNGLVFVHQGVVMDADKLNVIEHFDNNRIVLDYVNNVLRQNPYLSKDKDNHPFIELKRWKYEAEFTMGYEHLLTMIWFDDEMDASMSLKEIIEEKTRNIEYMKHSIFFDLDNL